jgi:hypothetical protein
MSLPEEGYAGDWPNRLTEETHRGLLEDLNVAGWISTQVGSDGESVQVGLVRAEGRGSTTPDHAISALRLGVADGGVWPGYTVATDPDTGKIALGYEGPVDPRYQSFLQDAVRLGYGIDGQLIKSSAYPTALEQWRFRHQNSAIPARFESLDPHLEDGLKAARDQVVFKEGGLLEFQDLLRTYAGLNILSDGPTKLPLMKASLEIEKILSGEPDEVADYLLDLVLNRADSALKAHLERKQVALLEEDPEIAAAYIHEVLLDDPKKGRKPLTESEFQGVVDFEGDPERTKESKISLLAKVVYYSRRTMSPEGIALMLDDEIDLLNHKTPRQIIDSGSTEEVRNLIVWRKNG